MKKIPFLVIKNFISPLTCESIINDLKVLKTPPMIGQNGKPKKMLFLSKLHEMRISQVFEQFVPTIERHFDFEYFGMHRMSFEWYPENSEAESPKSDGFSKIKGEWQRYKEIDFTGIVWLNDSNESTYFDPSFECFGGKLEFPTFDVSFSPERGSCIIFPSAPNFIHTVSNVKAGSLTQIRLTIRSEKPYNYVPLNFEHNPDNWNL